MKKLLLLISMTVCFTVHSAEQEEQTSDTSAIVDTETKGDINARDDDGYTVLHHAIMNADFEKVTTLLDDSSLDLSLTTPPTEDLPALSPLTLAAETWQILAAKDIPPFEILLRLINEDKKENVSSIITLLKSKRLIASPEEITQFETRHPNSPIVPYIKFSLYLSTEENLSQMFSSLGAQEENQD